MKICRFDDNRVGVVRGDEVFDITAYAERAMGGQQRIGASDSLIARLGGVPRDADARLPGCPRRSLADVRLLSPVRAPGKIVAAPVNYRAHIAEMLASNVSPGTTSGHREGGAVPQGDLLPRRAVEGIAVRFPERRTDYEAELVAIIGREAPRCRARTRSTTWPGTASASTSRCGAPRIGASGSPWTPTPCSAPG